MSQTQLLLAKRIELQADIDTAQTVLERTTANWIMAGFLDALLCMDSVEAFWPGDFKQQVEQQISERSEQ